MGVQQTEMGFATLCCSSSSSVFPQQSPAFANLVSLRAKSRTAKPKSFVSCSGNLNDNSVSVILLAGGKGKRMGVSLYPHSLSLSPIFFFAICSDWARFTTSNAILFAYFTGHHAKAVPSAAWPTHRALQVNRLL